MDRKKFIKNGIISLGAIVALPFAVTSCSKDDGDISTASPTDGNGNNPNNCDVSPTETIGPFPIITPAQLAQANIIGNRTGIPLLINITIHDQSNGCAPLANVFVDVWQCDRDGNYSQYGGNFYKALTILIKIFFGEGRPPMLTEKFHSLVFFQAGTQGEHRIFM